MKHIIAIFETWSAFMTRYLVIMLDDAHDQNFIWILTSRMLQSSPIKEISSQDYEVIKDLS